MQKAEQGAAAPARAGTLKAAIIGFGKVGQTRARVLDGQEGVAHRPGRCR